MTRPSVLVLIPATIRPKIIRKTLRSFSEKMFKISNPDVEIKALLHIDAIGDLENSTIVDVHLLVDSFIDIYDYHISRNHHSLTNSFFWLWSKAAKAGFDYCFYLEDDWQLLEEVRLLDMIEVMDRYKTLGLLRLPFKPTDKRYSKNWRHYFPWNGSYFECQENDKPHIGWCGHPGMVRPSFIRSTLPHYDPRYCPERQMKGLHWPSPMAQEVMKWEYGVFGIPAGPAFVRDIGRSWRVENNIVKLSDTSWQFTKGEK